jgi:citrate/tricarballylate utilization protein
MPLLDALIRDAQECATGSTPLRPHETEVSRILTICNACRYCEGFCAVFPAMTRRLEFSKADVHYLANLCHNCGACYHACQYAPPHEFAVNVPQAMAQVRLATYIDYAWPAPFGALYKRNGLTLSMATAFGLALFLLLAIWRNGTLMVAAPHGNFYAIFPHNLMALLFGAVFGFALLALGLGVRRFWHDVSPGAAGIEAVTETVRHAATLTYLGGGHGEGCNEADDRFTLARRRYHHLTMYGFLFCFAATSTATLYHYLLHWEAPYPVFSLPVLFGIVGGIGLVIGPLGLLRLNLQRDIRAGDRRQQPMDRGFIALLLLTSITGLALLAWRESVAIGWLLALHLGMVMALFLTLPYGKFAHGVFRTAALLKSAIEKRQPNRLQLGAE